jgi:hypothetical protein
MRLDGVDDFFSVFDFLKYVWHDYPHVKTRWHRLKHQISADVATRSFRLNIERKRETKDALLDGPRAAETAAHPRQKGGSRVREIPAISARHTELADAERQFELKRAAEDWQQSLGERQIILERQKFELAQQWDLSLRERHLALEKHKAELAEDCEQSLREGTLVPVHQLDHKNYTVAEGAPVQEILKGMLGPRCDENRDASHQLELKIQTLHAGDSAKPNMKVEMWRFLGDGTTWVNATSIFKYMYAGARDHFARMQKTHFETYHIPHKLLEVQGVRTIFLFSTTNFTGTNLVPDFPAFRRRRLGNQVLKLNWS